VRYSGLALSFGLLMVILAGLGFLGGQALDGRLGTFPLFAILGVLAGIGLAFYDLVRELALADRVERRYRDQLSERRAEQPEGRRADRSGRRRKDGREGQPTRRRRASRREGRPAQGRKINGREDG